MSTLHIASGSAMVVDLQTNKIIYASNPDVIVPIASVSKLMTGLIVLEAKQNMDEYIDINIKDTPEMKGVFSRVKIGSEMPRPDVLGKPRRRQPGPPLPGRLPGIYRGNERQGQGAGHDQHPLR